MKIVWSQDRLLHALFFSYMQKPPFFFTEASFSYEMFSYILLPMVIFAAGFNLDKHRFFRFGGYIAALGITGTVPRKTLTKNHSN